MIIDPHPLCMALATAAVVAAATAGTSGDSPVIGLLQGSGLRGWAPDSGHAPRVKLSAGTLELEAGRGRLVYTGAPRGAVVLPGFELELDVRSVGGGEAAIQLYAERGSVAGAPLEVQLGQGRESRRGLGARVQTGSLLGIRPLYAPVGSRGAWVPLRITAVGRHIVIERSGVRVVDVTLPEGGRPLAGSVALVGHAGRGHVELRGMRLRPLATIEDAPAAETDEADREIAALTAAGFPLIDLHTHLKGGLTLEETLEHMRRTGINHGVAVNGGVGFPITDDAGIERFRQSMVGAPVWIGLQAEGREWPTLFSREAIARFDYVFSDAMTIIDHRGKRARLWMKDEVDIPDTNAFMERLVSTIEGILDHEPVDIYANPTFLPEEIAGEYDALWTSERMDRVISAAVRNHVAIEIGSGLRIPGPVFIRRAKRAGVRFTLGTNNGDRALRKLEYALRMIRECGLTASDMWTPDPAGPRASRTPPAPGKQCESLREESGSTTLNE